MKSLRHTTIIFTLFLFATIVFGVNSADRPSVVLIFSDDQGYNDVSCFGGDIPTPHIDSIARDGARLTDFYVSLPVCTPSRYSLLTGQLPNRSKDQLIPPMMFAEDADLDRGIRPGETTLAAMLKTVGYKTALVGKWHLGHGDTKFLPTQHGFDSFYGHTGGCIDYFTMRYGNRPSWYRDNRLIVEGGYATDLMTDEAVRIIRDTPADQPLFLYLAYNAPHFAKSWDDSAKDFTHTLQAKPEDIAAFGSIANRDRRVYAAMVKSMDDGIGRVLDALAEGRRDRDTIVLFICDNGADPNYGGSNAPLRGAKHTLFEGGVRVPAVIKWPRRIAPDGAIAQPASALDLVPTLASWIGFKTTGLPIDGVDLSPAIFEGKTVTRDLYFNRGFDKALRRGDWKYLQDLDGAPMLFNLANDREEQHDLAAVYPAKLNELMSAHKAISATHRQPDIPPRFREARGKQ
ncbi:MAG: sulfatase-like hydrolase/transferase [Planctomycetota bacterium]